MTTDDRQPGRDGATAPPPRGGRLDRHAGRHEIPTHDYEPRTATRLTKEVIGAGGGVAWSFASGTEHQVLGDGPRERPGLQSPALVAIVRILQVVHIARDDVMRKGIPRARRTPS